MYKSVLVIDDHKMVANGIKLIIGNLFEDFYTALDAMSGVRKALQFFPELIIIDYSLPDSAGDLLVRELKFKLPKTKVLAYTFTYSSDVIIKLVKAGINGYVLKKGSDDEFIKAVHTIMYGREYFCQEARIHIVNNFANAEDDFTTIYLIANFKFSGKEIEMIRLLCKQMTTREIASSLHLTFR